VTSFQPRVGQRRVRVRRSDLDRFIEAGSRKTSPEAEGFWGGAEVGLSRLGDPVLWERFGAAAARDDDAAGDIDAGELAAAFRELADASNVLGASIASDESTAAGESATDSGTRPSRWKLP
jgi:hypothetical protein